MDLVVVASPLMSVYPSVLLSSSTSTPCRVYDSLRILSIFSLIHAALVLKLALGNKPYSASRVCLLVLYISDLLFSH